jgi:hypothetical protein
MNKYWMQQVHDANIIHNIIDMSLHCITIRSGNNQQELTGQSVSTCLTFWLEKQDPLPQHSHPEAVMNRHILKSRGSLEQDGSRSRKYNHQQPPLLHTLTDSITVLLYTKLNK